MKKALLTSFLILISFFVHAYGFNDSTCLNFHKGKFYYYDSLNNRVIVIRKKRKQIEYNEGTGVKTTLKIKWISDCEYTLKQIWTNSKSWRKYNYGVSTTFMKPIDEKTYEYNCGCKDEKKKALKGLMTKL
jgi:hypothetical protein